MTRHTNDEGTRGNNTQQQRRTTGVRRILRLASWGYLLAGGALMATFGPDVLTRKIWLPGIEFEMRLGFVIGIATFVGGAYLLWSRGRDPNR